MLCDVSYLRTLPPLTSVSSPIHQRPSATTASLTALQNLITPSSTITTSMVSNTSNCDNTDTNTNTNGNYNYND